MIEEIRPEEKKPICRRRWAKKTKKMIRSNLLEEDPVEEDRLSNRRNYPAINPPLLRRRVASFVDGLIVEIVFGGVVKNGFYHGGH